MHNKCILTLHLYFQVAQGENELARQLYERLLDRTGHVKVWISFAKFELSAETEEGDDMNIDLARRVYERANDHLRALAEKESRVVLLEAWRDFESQHGTERTFEKVIDKMPRRVKKRQKIVSESGVEEGWEEVFDYIFPEDEMARPNLKLLAAAKNWKKTTTVPTTTTVPDIPAENDESSVPETTTQADEE